MDSNWKKDLYVNDDGAWWKVLANALDDLHGAPPLHSGADIHNEAVDGVFETMRNSSAVHATPLRVEREVGQDTSGVTASHHQEHKERHDDRVIRPNAQVQMEMDGVLRDPDNGSTATQYTTSARASKDVNPTLPAEMAVDALVTTRRSRFEEITFKSGARVLKVDGYVRLNNLQFYFPSGKYIKPRGDDADAAQAKQTFTKLRVPGTAVVRLADQTAKRNVIGSIVARIGRSVPLPENEHILQVYVRGALKRFDNIGAKVVLLNRVIKKEKIESQPRLCAVQIESKIKQHFPGSTCRRVELTLCAIRWQPVGPVHPRIIILKHRLPDGAVQLFEEYSSREYDDENALIIGENTVYQDELLHANHVPLLTQAQAVLHAWRLFIASSTSAPMFVRREYSNDRVLELMGLSREVYRTVAQVLRSETLHFCQRTREVLQQMLEASEIFSDVMQTQFRSDRQPKTPHECVVHLCAISHLSVAEGVLLLASDGGVWNDIKNFDVRKARGQQIIANALVHIMQAGMPAEVEVPFNTSVFDVLCRHVDVPFEGFAGIFVDEQCRLLFNCSLDMFSRLASAPSSDSGDPVAQELRKRWNVAVNDAILQLQSIREGNAMPAAHIAALVGLSMLRERCPSVKVCVRDVHDNERFTFRIGDESSESLTLELVIYVVNAGNGCHLYVAEEIKTQMPIPKTVEQVVRCRTVGVRADGTIGEEVISFTVPAAQVRNVERTTAVHDWSTPKHSTLQQSDSYRHAKLTKFQMIMRCIANVLYASFIPRSTFFQQALRKFVQVVDAVDSKVFEYLLAGVMGSRAAETPNQRKQREELVSCVRRYNVDQDSAMLISSLRRVLTDVPPYMQVMRAQLPVPAYMKAFLRRPPNCRDRYQQLLQAMRTVVDGMDTDMQDDNVDALLMSSLLAFCTAMSIDDRCVYDDHTERINFVDVVYSVPDPSALVALVECVHQQWHSNDTLSPNTKSMLFEVAFVLRTMRLVDGDALDAFASERCEAYHRQVLSCLQAPQAVERSLSGGSQHDSVPNVRLVFNLTYESVCVQCTVVRCLRQATCVDPTLFSGYYAYYGARAMLSLGWRQLVAGTMTSKLFSRFDFCSFARDAIKSISRLRSDDCSSLSALRDPDVQVPTVSHLSEKEIRFLLEDHLKFDLVEVGTIADIVGRGNVGLEQLCGRRSRVFVLNGKEKDADMPHWIAAVIAFDKEQQLLHMVVTDMLPVQHTDLPPYLGGRTNNGPTPVSLPAADYGAQTSATHNVDINTSHTDVCNGRHQGINHTRPSATDSFPKKKKRRVEERTNKSNTPQTKPLPPLPRSRAGAQQRPFRAEEIGGEGILQHSTSSLVGGAPQSDIPLVAAFEAMRDPLQRMLICLETEFAAVVELERDCTNVRGRFEVFRVPLLKSLEMLCRSMANSRRTKVDTESSGRISFLGNLETCTLDANIVVHLVESINSEQFRLERERSLSNDLQAVLLEVAYVLFELTGEQRLLRNGHCRKSELHRKVLTWLQACPAVIRSFKVRSNNDHNECRLSTFNLETTTFPVRITVVHRLHQQVGVEIRASCAYYSAFSVSKLSSLKRSEIIHPDKTVLSNMLTRSNFGDFCDTAVPTIAKHRENNIKQLSSLFDGDVDIPRVSQLSFTEIGTIVDEHVSLSTMQGMLSISKQAHMSTEGKVTVCVANTSEGGSHWIAAATVYEDGVLHMIVIDSLFDQVDVVPGYIVNAIAGSREL